MDEERSITDEEDFADEGRYEPAGADEENARSAEAQGDDEDVENVDPAVSGVAGEASRGDVAEQEAPWIPPRVRDRPEVGLETPEGDAVEGSQPW